MLLLERLIIAWVEYCRRVKIFTQGLPTFMHGYGSVTKHPYQPKVRQLVLLFALAATSKCASDVSAVGSGHLQNSVVQAVVSSGPLFYVFRQRCLLYTELTWSLKL